MFRRGIFFSLSLILCLGSGCASYFKRKECEKTNWYQHGFNVAMKGKRIDSDSFVKECTKVEAEVNFADLDTGFKAGMAKYCEPQTVFQVGKNGEPFSTEMCDGSDLRLLKAKHLEGVKVFCEPENGEAFGKTGKVYQDVCPKEMEKAFLVEYRKGRKIFLNHLVDEKERKIDDIELSISDYQRERNLKVVQLAAMPSGKVYQRKKTYNPVTRSYSEEVAVKDDEDVKRRRQDIESDINSIDYKIGNLEDERSRLKEEIRQLRQEIISL